MKQRNNHARSKRKRKLLRLKNFFKRIITKREQKKIQALKPKGVTIIGNAKDLAISVHELFPNGDYGFMFSKGHRYIPNQRQKRKLRRQQPHGR